MTDAVELVEVKEIKNARRIYHNVIDILLLKKSYECVMYYRGAGLVCSCILCGNDKGCGERNKSFIT